ncbi:MAG TPA: hypothetical protein VNJ47_01705 [Nevskiales bacterium]|nr:hypothetical protein [Nevskiales bacterium]
MARKNRGHWLAALVLLAVGAAGGAWLARHALPALGLDERPPARATDGDIRTVDFRNFTYAVYCVSEDGRPIEITVRDGEFRRESEHDPLLLNVLSVSYGDLTGDGAPEAAVATGCNTGGTGQFTEGLVYTMRGGQPVLIGRVEGGDRAFGGIASLAIERGRLVVERYATDEDGPACCPRYIDTTRLRWEGAELVPEGGAVRRPAPNE